MGNGMMEMLDTLLDSCLEHGFRPKDLSWLMSPQGLQDLKVDTALTLAAATFADVDHKIYRNIPIIVSDLVPPDYFLLGPTERVKEMLRQAREIRKKKSG